MKIIVANWKMNLTETSQVENFLKEFQNRLKKNIVFSKKNKEIIFCLSFCHLFLFKKNKQIKLGSQDVFWQKQGAFTGEISPLMLKNLGCQYVIIGHSERREYLKETDEMINKKVLIALETGLKVILCVGENLSIHRQGKKAVKKFIKNQLEKDLKGIHNSKFIIHDSIIVAYEPIWAISTSRAGISCYPEDVLEMIKFIKDILNSIFYIPNSCILYGGSVDAKNAKDYLKEKEIDGVLVGGTSAKVKDFLEICLTDV